MAGNVHEFTDSSFESEVLQATEPVLVDFWAPWCGPCRRIAPMIEELANDNEGRIKVGKMNLDDSPHTPQKYGVSTIPTLLVFKGGEVAERFGAGQPKNRIQEALDKAAD